MQGPDGKGMLGMFEEEQGHLCDRREVGGRVIGDEVTDLDCVWLHGSHLRRSSVLQSMACGLQPCMHFGKLISLSLSF